ncbi:MAG: MBL fold metallo-hydrolase [Nitrososphaerota archaeon]
MRVWGFGGLEEIGGNKFYLESRGEGVFLDFGISYSARRRFFGWVLRPKRYALLASLLASGSIPPIRNLYDEELSDPTGLVEEMLQKSPELDVQGVIVSHPHSDHLGHISLLKKEIPIYLGIASFKIARTKELSKPNRTVEEKIFIDGEREVNLFKTGQKPKIGVFEVRPVHVDHSVPGSYGLIVHSPEGSLAYSGDLRLHGPKKSFTEEFIQTVVSEGVDVLLLEGTRIEEEENVTESDVKRGLASTISGRRGLVAVLTGLLDYDRFSSIASASKSANRKILVSPRMALMLETFHSLGVTPKELLPGEGLVEVLFERKGSGRLESQDYHGREKEYLEKILDRGIPLRADLDISSHQERYTIVLNSPDDVLDLLPIRPADDSIFIYSTSEPHTEEQEIDRERVENWLNLMNMRSIQVHASGHANREELGYVLSETRPRRVIPIHTEKPQLFQDLLAKFSPSSKLINAAPRIPTVI